MEDETNKKNCSTGKEEKDDRYVAIGSGGWGGGGGGLVIFASAVPLTGRALISASGVSLTGRALDFCVRGIPDRKGP